MQIKSVKVALVSLLSVSVLASCALTPSIGEKPAEVPPQLKVNDKDPKKNTWDKPSAFGPVPAELAASGEKVCATLNTEDMQFKAIGYHPKAKNVDGSTFPSGGYFCVRK